MLQLAAALLVVILSLINVFESPRAAPGVVGTHPAPFATGVSLVSSGNRQSAPRAPGTLAVALNQVNQPPPTPTESARAQSLGSSTLTALLCLLALSVSSIVGSFALKRHFDRIRPD